MNFERTIIGGIELEVISLNTVIVGSGAAAFNAADRLYSLGQRNIAIATEGINMGTSRNTGSDKQTYYKLTLAGNTTDSVADMARTLFEGGAMDGDIAFCEAALSARCFYRLVELGVPFPHNAFGEYIGYKTDHDPRQRATSAGPLTSKYMTERLQEQVVSKGIPIFDGFMVVRILTVGSRCTGVLCFNTNCLNDINVRYTVFNAVNVVFATGGPAGLYAQSVYPESQNGAAGFSLEAGVKGKNLTEWQYGIASLKFRWNLSGTYQQVLPRYISTDADGSNAYEFLDKHFVTDTNMLNAIFLKGYQWPFDPRKISDYGSSLIDVLVYDEIVHKGRCVFLDYTQNPKVLKSDLSNTGTECLQYLKNSGAMQDTPIERLAHMNPAAVELYRKNGIDLYSELLEIAVCAQHNNGGLSGDMWWESNIKHFFPIGEANGTHGVYRPGGSALNSGQCGGLRAAQRITGVYNQEPKNLIEFLDSAMTPIQERIGQIECIIKNKVTGNTVDLRKKIGDRMSKYASHIRNEKGLTNILLAAQAELSDYFQTAAISGLHELPLALSNYDLLIAQVTYVSAMLDYIKAGGISRGSYLICESESYRDFRKGTDKLSGMIQETEYKKGTAVCSWREVRPIPSLDYWFENVWKEYNASHGSEVNT